MLVENSGSAAPAASCNVSANDVKSFSFPFNIPVAVTPATPMSALLYAGP